MCGIVGIFPKSDRISPEQSNALREGIRALSHRGPDDSGCWRHDQTGVLLGHTRLSILDLSPAGNQPMISHSNRYVIVFNGEIYNFRTIRKELEALGQTRWNGHADTEVLLSAIEHWGVEGALKRAVGMFAFALWDQETHSLYIARDRFGEKPLYYGFSQGGLIFASELKALKKFPDFSRELDRDALALYLRFNCIPAPFSIYRGIFKLPAGTCLRLTSSDVDAGQLDSPTPYWDASTIAEHGQKQPFSGSEISAIDGLQQLLQEAIAGQMISDVPLGAFLSGGIDSSTVVSLMQAQSSRPVNTFTIGFHEQGYDEARHANAVARHLGTNHTELYVTPQQALDVIPKLPDLYDEPFSDPSQIPTFLVSELAKQHVTVALTGDGGDELFGGYNRYYWAPNIWRKIRLFPAPLRSALAAALVAIPPGKWDSIFDFTASLLPKGWRYGTPGDKLHKVAEVLSSSTPDEVYFRLISNWKRPDSIVLNSTEPNLIYSDKRRWPTVPDIEQCMMFLDQVCYLPDTILTKVDRAGMGVSLETRAPFLDHRVAEFSWALPLSMKIRQGQGKWILNQILSRHIPRDLIERPKMGFGVPVDSWLRGPLKDWAECLLDDKRLAGEGVFNTYSIRQKWREHLSGKRNWASPLWNILMFQAWLEVGG